MNLLLAPSDAWWVAIAFDTAWKSVVVLTCAGVLVLALRRSAAAARHLVWSLALAGTLVLPLLTVALPTWSWPLLPSAAVATVPEVKGAEGAGVTSSPRLIGFDQPGEHAGSDGAADDGAGPGPAAPTRWRSITTVGATSVPIMSKPGLWPPQRWALLVWLAGAALVLAGPLLGRLCLLAAVRGAVPIDRGEWTELMQTISRQLGLCRRVTILRSDRAAMPVTWGWMRPVVLLPSRADDWTHVRRRDVLLHELAHVRRFDCLTQSVAQMACAAYWFNPLAWIAARRMRIERERACDDVVLLAGSSATDYAAHLLELARDLRADRLTALAAVAMAQPGPLEGRLLAILDSKRSRSGIRFRSAVLVTAALFGGLMPLAAVRLGAHAATPIEARASQIADARQAAAAPDARMAVSGVVVDERGNPLPNAAVMVYTQPKQFKRPMLFLFENPLIIGEARSDGSGRFRIDAQRTSSSTHDLLGITALAPGHGLGWVEVDPDALEPTAKIALRPEFVIEGRLFDVQGQPARGVKVVILGIQSSEHGEPAGPIFVDRPTEPLAAWPAPATTDAEGHFAIRGVGRDLSVELAIDDQRFAAQRTGVATGGSVVPGPRDFLRPAIKLDSKSGPAKLTLALEPAQIIAGRVTFADSGKPVPHAPLSVTSRSDTRRGARISRFEADSEGRFRINPPTGDHFHLATQSPNGQPYLAVTRTIDWPKGAVEQTVEFALPRGGVIAGKVTEQGSGKPVGGAIVRFTPYSVPGRSSTNNEGVPSVTSSDGSFQIAGVPDRGYVVIQGPSDDYVLRELGAAGGVFNAQPGNRRFHAHAYRALELKPATASQEVHLTIKRGLTVKGRVVGPDDRPVQDALILSRIIMRSMPIGGWKMWLPTLSPGRVREGRFEIHGLDPETKVPVHFLDSEHELGATIELSGKAAPSGPVTVRLERCGTARVRLVDPDGKPVSGQGLSTSLLVTPGVSFAARDRNPGMLVSEGADLSRLDPGHYKTYPLSDAQGQIIYPALIPGATYRFVDPTTMRSPDGPHIRKEFSVKPGENLDLGDILIENPALAK